MPARNEHGRDCNPAAILLDGGANTASPHEPGGASLELLPGNQQHSDYDQRGRADLARGQLLDIFEKN